MEQKAVDSVGRWETDKDIGIGDECRYQENFYRCVDGGSNGTTGTVAPTHTTGDSGMAGVLVAVTVCCGVICIVVLACAVLPPSPEMD